MPDYVRSMRELKPGMVVYFIHDDWFFSRPRFFEMTVIEVINEGTGSIRYIPVNRPRSVRKGGGLLFGIKKAIKRGQVRKVL